MPHGLDLAYRTGHAVTAIRGTSPLVSYPAPRTLVAARDPRAGGAVVVAIPRRAARPLRDEVTRVGSFATLDDRHRCNLAKVLAELGWDDTSALVASVDGPTVTVRLGTRTAPQMIPVGVDHDRRLTLPPTITGALDLHPRDQLFAVALPATGELRLYAAVDVMQQLTGTKSAEEVLAAATAFTPAPTRRSRVRPGWQPDTG